ncbi:hypothetical protein T310_8811, partial [Rasamsonia emersonii CBS 393.64]
CSREPPCPARSLQIQISLAPPSLSALRDSIPPARAGLSIRSGNRRNLLARCEKSLLLLLLHYCRLVRYPRDAPRTTSCGPLRRRMRIAGPRRSANLSLPGTTSPTSSHPSSLPPLSALVPFSPSCVPLASALLSISLVPSSPSCGSTATVKE